MEIENVFDSQVWQQVNTARQCLENAMVAASALKHRALSKDIDLVRSEIMTLQVKCSQLSKGS
jgi:hypothetical protein